MYTETSGLPPRRPAISPAIRKSLGFNSATPPPLLSRHRNTLNLGHRPSLISKPEFSVKICGALDANLGLHTTMEDFIIKEPDLLGNG